MSYGPDAVHELIQESGWSYPVSRNRLEREHALENIQIDSKGNTIMLAELLGKTEVERFESKEDLEEKLGPVCKEESRRRAGGIIGRIRRMLPGM